MAQSATSILLALTPPARPNGVVLAFTIYRSTSANAGSNSTSNASFATSASGTLIATLGAASTAFLDADTALLPYTRYWYCVGARNQLGIGLSDWTSALTLAARMCETFIRAQLL